MAKKISKEKKKVAKPIEKLSAKKASTSKGLNSSTPKAIKNSNKGKGKDLESKKAISKSKGATVLAKKESLKNKKSDVKLEKENKKISQDKPMKPMKLAKPMKPDPLAKETIKTKEEGAAKLSVKSSILTKTQAVKKENNPKKQQSVEIPSDVPDTEDGRKWAELRKKHGNDPATVYSISGTFEANTALEHKVLGWGYIISVLNDRLEVVFKHGIKHLISNYKTK